METTKTKLTMSTTHVENMSAAQTKLVSRATNNVQHHNVLDSVSAEVRNRRLSDVSQLGCCDTKNVLDNQSGTKKNAAAFCDVQKNHTTPALGVDVMLASENVCDGKNKWGGSCFQGKTPVNIAHQKGHLNIVQHIINHHKIPPDILEQWRQDSALPTKFSYMRW